MASNDWSNFFKGSEAGGKKAAKSGGDWKSFFGEGGGEAKEAKSDAGGGVVGLGRKALGKVLGSAPVRTALDVVDTPRALVASTVKEGIDAAQGEGFSLRDLAEQTDDNLGFGTILEEEAGNLPINVKRALGFVGDVGLDPLTYLTFGASAVAKTAAKEGAEAVVEQGAKGLAREGTRLTARQVADRAIDLGRTDLADAVLKKRGAAALSKAEQAEIGVKNSVRFMGVELGSGDGISRLRMAITNPVLDKAKDSSIATAIARATDPLAQSMAELRRTKPGLARQLERIERSTRNEGGGLRTEARRELDQIAKRHGPVVDRDVVRQLIEDGAARQAAKKTPEGLAARSLSIWFEKTRRKAQKLTGRDIPKIEDYLPHKLTDEFRQVLEEVGDGGRRGGRESFEVKRQHRVGSKWFGRELETGSIDEMERIAREELGDNYVQVFQNDPFALAQSYAESVGRMVGDRRFQAELEKQGVIEHFDREALNGSEALERRLGQKKAKNIKGAKAAREASDKTLARVGAAAERPLVAADGALDAEMAAGAARGAADSEDELVEALRSEGVDLEGQLDFDAQGAALDGWEHHAAELEVRLNEIADEIAAATERKAAHLADEAAHLKEAERLAKAAARQEDKTLAEIARLESVAAAQRARAVARRRTASEFEAEIRKMNVPARQEEWARIVQEGLTAPLKSDPTRFADPKVAEVLAELSEKATPAQVGAFLKSYDALLGRWKAYSLLSPGFHIRNYLGGQWNNWMAGVDAKVQRQFPAVVRAYKKNGLQGVEARFGKDWRDVVEQAERLDVWGGHNMRDLADVGMSSRTGVAQRAANRVGVDVGPGVNKLDPTSMDFVPLAFNMKQGEKVERLLRGPLFADRIFKGFSPEAALDDVIKYHFDYSELSKFETNVARRFVPFYTWTRKNFPLQLENMVRNPGKLNRYNAVARNLSLGVERPEGEPAYYGDLLAMLTPFKSPKGDAVYAVPDLPFTRLGEPLNDQAVNGLTPFVKMPIEVSTNHSFFTDSPLTYQGEEPTVIPATWRPLAPFLEQLDGLGGLPRVSRGEGGEYLMDRKEAYKVEQSLPLLGRLRRMAPNEKKYQDRAMTTYLSVLAGVGSRTLTQSEIDVQLRQKKDG